MSIPVNKTLEDIRTEMFARINEVQEEYIQKGWLPALLNLNKGIIRGMIELWSWGLFQLYKFLMIVLGQAFPASATDLWLDLHCKQVGIERKSATKTIGTVWFLRVDTTGNVPIPSGRILKTLPDGAGKVYRFITMEDVVMTDGLSAVAVKVQAENTGAGANVTMGQISEIVTVIDGIDSVENRADWLESEGTDQESNESLFARYQLKWQEGAGYTKYAYQGWALSVAGAEEVAVLDQHPRGQGTVDVIVRGTAGVPTQQVLDKVATAIEAVRHQNDNVQVRGVTPHNILIEGTLQYKPGYIKEEILTAVDQQIRALFDYSAKDKINIPFSIGEDVTLDRLTATAMQVPGVKSTPWAQPLSDTGVSNDGLAFLETLNVDAVEASEG
ncbi:MAG: baseplate J/gp47 family protein [Desulfobacteraceae bacterium]|nr:baseplate J/gp47 family protein [Desulfobacteraceae bacterium]